VEEEEEEEKEGCGPGLSDRLHGPPSERRGQSEAGRRRKDETYVVCVRADRPKSKLIRLKRKENKRQENQSSLLIDDAPRSFSFIFLF
jgi:hypothetical protein